MIELRVLEPAADLDLFREAHNWRRSKRHIGANEASFEDLIDPDPRQITIGVFNGQYCAMFLLYEDAPGYFNAHFTSKRGTPKESLIQAGEQIRDAFMENGAVELCAWITARNRALRTYLEALKFIPAERKTLEKLKAGDSGSLPAMKEFIKYVYSGR